jgi:hypothetical protein
MNCSSIGMVFATVAAAASVGKPRIQRAAYRPNDSHNSGRVRGGVSNFMIDREGRGGGAGVLRIFIPIFRSS